MDRLRGRLFALIELADMADYREEAFKSLVRTLTYEAQRDLQRYLRRRPNGRH